MHGDDSGVDMRPACPDAPAPGEAAITFVTAGVELTELLSEVVRSCYVPDWSTATWIPLITAAARSA